MWQFIPKPNKNTLNPPQSWVPIPETILTLKPLQQVEHIFMFKEGH